MKNFKKRKLDEARRSEPSLYSGEEGGEREASDEREHEAGGPHHSEEEAEAARGGVHRPAAGAKKMTAQEKTKLYWDIIRRGRRESHRRRKAKGKARKEKRETKTRVLAQVAASSGSKRAKKALKDSTEYHRLGSVLAEALRVKNEEPRSSNAYVRKLAESRYGREQNKFRRNPTTAESGDATVRGIKKRRSRAEQKANDDKKKKDIALASVAAGSGSKKAAADLKRLQKDD